MVRLEKSRYSLLRQPLMHLSMNQLFARSVIEDRVEGLVMVDDVDEPRSFYVLHPYGMSLVFGRANNEAFNTALKDYLLGRDGQRTAVEFLQAEPGAWDQVLSGMFEGEVGPIDQQEALGCRVGEDQRINFRFKQEQFEQVREGLQGRDLCVVRTDEFMCRNLEGAVIPRYFWRGDADFLERGAGFSVVMDGLAASTAFSAFIHDHYFEIGIETLSNYRGRGLAMHACAALIDYCIANAYQPVWACRGGNVGSYKLATRLGFEVTQRLPFYRLGMPNRS